MTACSTCPGTDLCERCQTCGLLAPLHRRRVLSRHARQLRDRAVTAPVGAIVGIYVDLVQRVASGDVIETQSGRRYRVIDVRVQARGRHVGRQHLRVGVMARGDPLPDSGMLYPIRWYARGRGKR